VTLRVVRAVEVTSRATVAEMMLMIPTIDQGIITTSQLQRSVDGELNADREIGVDEIAEQQVASRSFSVVAALPLPAHGSLSYAGVARDVINLSFFVTLTDDDPIGIHCGSAWSPSSERIAAVAPSPVPKLPRS
jgi:hypothetical protein